MNIVKRELKAGLKPFIFWSLGLFVLVFAGITKYTGFETGGAAADELIAAFPRPLRAMLGIADVDIKTLAGYYAIIIYYSMICIAIYALSLGANAVGRESVDKTYEFLFTKPCSRSKILGLKLLAGLIYLFVFCLLNYLFSIAAINILKLSENINSEIRMFSISILVIGLMFYAMSAFLTSIIKHIEKGFLYSNLLFLIMFVLGMIYDMLENAEALRVFTPFRYFVPSEIINGKLNIVYLVISLVFCAVFTLIAFYEFEKRDLQASE